MSPRVWLDTRCHVSQPRIGNRRLRGQLVESLLHHRPHVIVDLVDVRIFAELRGDVDRFQHLRDDLGGQRQIGRNSGAEPEWEAERQRQDCAAQQAFYAQPLGQPGSPGQIQLSFLPADGHRGHDGHAGLDRRRTYPLRPLKSMTFSESVGRYAS